MPHEPQPPRIEDELAESLSGAWHDLQEKAARENPGAMREAEKLFLEWASKLDGILKGRKS